MSESVPLEAAHVVAVIGGATSGSEIARVLAERRVIVIVFEQNPRPYGKIEDGLPRWHVKQRRDEYEEINQRLVHPNIHYVPLTRMGRDLDFNELREAWGLSAVVLTNGAWRDRSFPVDGADQFIDRGLVYQNPLIYWFNHYLEASYDGPRYVLSPGITVVGGGLASIDVVKVLQIEMTLQALKQRGITEEMLKLEREGIEPVLKNHSLSWADLGVAPCRLYYRRRVLDMPLSDIAPDATPKRAEAMRQARAKILDKAQRKFLFEFQELSVPTGLVVEGDLMAGVMMSRTEAADGKVRTIPDSGQPVRAPMTISSIGSIPEPIPGIPQRGEVYQYVDADVGLLIEAHTAIYAAGNVLTGKGNIKDSLVSGTQIGIHVAERYLGLAGNDEDGSPFTEAKREEAHQEGLRMAASINAREWIAPAQVAAIIERVRERQRAVGYDGDYRGWIKKVTPPDLQ
jgi:ferredoxin/flavodoxin---NADP+ reductase